MAVLGTLAIEIAYVDLVAGAIVGCTFSCLLASLLMFAFCPPNKLTDHCTPNQIVAMSMAFDSQA